MSTDVLERPTPSTGAPADAPPRLGHAIARSIAPRRLSDRGLELLPLLLIVGVQVFLSTRLPSTAWGDEGLYITAGHRVLTDWAGGADVSQWNYDAYFSGAPWAYPVLAALLDSVGGIGLVRWFSLACTVVATLAVHAVARRWFGTSAARYGAFVFASAASISFLGFFATYDALCLALVAVTAYLAVCRTGIPSALLAGVTASAAVVVKYAGVLWLPFAVAAGLLTLWQVSRSRAVVRALVTTGAAAAVLVTLGLTVGRSLLPGLTVTTTDRRVLLPSSTGRLLADIALDIGPILVLAAAGGVMWMRRDRSKWLLLTVLALGGLVAPLHQLQIHERVAIHKHAGFGLVFLAPVAGFALWWLARKAVGRVLVAVLMLAVLVFSAERSHFLYTRTNISPSIIAEVQQLLQDPALRDGTGEIGSTDPNTFMYYTRGEADRLQWEYMSGAAVANSRYRAIVMSNIDTNDLILPTSTSLLQVALDNPDYRLELVQPLRPGYQNLKWFVFVRVD